MMRGTSGAKGSGGGMEQSGTVKSAMMIQALSEKSGLLGAIESTVTWPQSNMALSLATDAKRTHSTSTTTDIGNLLVPVAIILEEKKKEENYILFLKKNKDDFFKCESSLELSFRIKTGFIRRLLHLKKTTRMHSPLGVWPCRRHWPAQRRRCRSPTSFQYRPPWRWSRSRPLQCRSI